MHRENEVIYGVNPVLEALRSEGRNFTKIIIDKGKEKKGSIREILNTAKTKNIRINRGKHNELEALAGTNKHQGVVGLVSSVEAVDLYGLIEYVFKNRKDPLIALLDGVEDPGNLGSIIRSAEVLGVNGLVIPKDRAAGITPLVVKRSSGAAEHLPIAKVVNITSTIKELKKKGFWVIGLEKDSDRACYEYDYKGPTAVVIGGESKGIRRLVRENCDLIVSIPMKGKISSLNSAIAAALLFYEVMRNRQIKKGD